MNKNGTWSLDVLYKGFDDPKLQKDFEALEKVCERIIELSNNLSKENRGQVIETGLKLFEEFSLLIADIYGYASLMQTVDTTNTECNKVIERVIKLMNSTTVAETLFNEYIAATDDLETVISENDFLKVYEYKLLNIKKDSKYILDAKVEDALAKMDMCAGSAWSDQWQYITSTLKVDYDGETTTLSAIRNMAYDKDSKIRKAAYDAEIASYEKIKDAAAYSLNSIKMQTLTECQLRG